MALQEQLKQLGLNQSEITVYLFLLENGISTPPIVSQRTNIARTNCYNILESLKNKSLIQIQYHGKRAAYAPRDPSALAAMLDKKRDIIIGVLPELRGLFMSESNKLIIRYYEGFDEVKQIYQASLAAPVIYALGSTNQITDRMGTFLESYMQNIKSKNIDFYDLLSRKSAADGIKFKELLKGIYQYKLLPEDYGDPATDILLWSDNIALINLQDPVFGTVIKNKNIARTIQLVLKIIWNKI